MKMSKMACLCALFLLPFLGMTQEANIDLWDTWRIGFEKYEEAEKAFKKNDMDKALNLYRESQQTFLKLRKASPNWNKDVVTYRLSLCFRKINAIEKPRRDAAIAAKQKSEFEKLRQEVDTLKKQLRQTRVELIDAKSAAERNALSEKQVKKLMAENSELEKKIAAGNARISSLKADLVKADKSAEYQKQLLRAKTDFEKAGQEIRQLKKEVENQRERSRKFQDQRNKAESKMFRLEEQVKDLEVKKKEIAVLSEANKKMADVLNQLNQKLNQSERQVSAAQKTNQALSEKISDLESGKIQSPSVKKLREDLAAEKKQNLIQNGQIVKLNQDLKTQSALLEKANAENKKIVLELVKSTEAFSKLRAEYNALVKSSDEQKKMIDTARVLATENAVLKKNIEDIAKKYEDLRKTSKDAQSAKIVELTTELENARANFKITEERLKQAQENMKGSSSKLQQTIVKLEEEKTVLHKSAVLAKQEQTKIQNALDQLNAQFNTLKQEYEKLSKADSLLHKQLSEKKGTDEKVAALVKEVTALRNENSQLKIRSAAYDKLKKENELLQSKKGGSAVAMQAADQEKIRALSEQNKALEASLAAANEQIRKKNAELVAGSKNLNDSVALLKKQLVSAQDSETKIRKSLALLKMEYADLERKLSSSVSKDLLNKAKEDSDKLRKEFNALRTAKTESDAALRAAEEQIKLQGKRLELYAKEINPQAKGQITKLTAAVAELQEAKIQYESLLRELKSKQELLNEDNKAMRLANTSLQAEVAELKIKPEEYQKKIKDLSQKNKTLNELYKASQKKVDALSEKSKQDDQRISVLTGDLETVRKQAARYRSELNEWDNPDQGNLQEDLKKKNAAITQLVQETSDLKKEKEMLNTELLFSKDQVVKYKKLAQDINANLVMTNYVLSNVKIALARHTSAEEVEKVVNAHRAVKAREFKDAAPEKEIKKQVDLIAAEKDAHLSAKQKKERDAEYKKFMEKGLAAEKEKNYNSALEHYWHAESYHSGDGAVYLALSRLYLIKRDFQSARAHYRTAVQKYNVKRDPVFEEKLLKLASELK